MVEHSAARLDAVIERLATRDAPAVFHCSAGKDRTGVIAALLLGSLGVPHDVIVADYAATQEDLAGIVAKLSRSSGFGEMWKDLPPETLHADPETMDEFLSELCEQYGSVSGCVRAIGVGERVLDRLSERMLA